MARNYNTPRKTTDNPIARARVESGMTQEQLANIIGTDKRKVSEWERGTFIVPIPMMRKIADALGLDLMELLEEQSKPDTPSPIADARKAKGWAQTQLAKAIGVSQGLVSTYEHGAHIPTETLKRIADALDVDVDAITPPDGQKRPK